MKSLTIYPSFLCPFKCSFCFGNQENFSLLNTQQLEIFLNSHSKDFDKIYISGGEPMALNKLYFDELIDTIKKYNQNIFIKTYPYSLTNYRDDVEYIISYDFLARPTALSIWTNIMNFPKQFDMEMLLTPTLFKYHPNSIFQKLALLPNLKSVELKPYFKNSITTWNINETMVEKFISAWISSKLNVKFLNVNKEYILSLLNQPTKLKYEISNNLNILPDGLLYEDYFNEYDIHSFKKIETSKIKNYKQNIPESYNFYSTKILNWGSNI